MLKSGVAAPLRFLGPARRAHRVLRHHALKRDPPRIALQHALCVQCVLGAVALHPVCSGASRCRRAQQDRLRLVSPVSALPPVAAPPSRRPVRC